MDAYRFDKFVGAQSIASGIVQGALGDAIGKDASFGSASLSGTRIRPLSSADVDHPLSFKVAIGLAYRIRIDPKLYGQIAHGWERIIGSQRPENKRAPDLVDYLNVDRPRVLRIQRYEHNVGVMVYQLPSTLYLIPRTVKPGSFGVF